MPRRSLSKADRTQRMLFSKRGQNIVKRARITTKHHLPELDRTAIDQLVTVYTKTKTPRPESRMDTQARTIILWVVGLYTLLHTVHTVVYG
jgi:hypothetical protein